MVPTGDYQCRFDHKVLEEQIKLVIGNARDFKEQNINAESVQMAEPPPQTPTFVVAGRRHDIANPQPTLFRSYDCRGYPADKCMVWEAARATTAAPTFFKEITIDVPKPGGPYVDGGVTGHNNPALLALDEVERKWPKEYEEKRFAVVSIGTGQQRPVDLPEPKQSSGLLRFMPGTRIKQGTEASLRILHKLAQLSMQSEQVQDRVNKISKRNPPFLYYRFNVPDIGGIGLQECDQLPKLSQITTGYLMKGDVDDLLWDCVRKLWSPRNESI
jgi:hypothetical protein